MNITEFAESHRLKTQRDGCGDVIVPGKSGHIYEYSDSELGVIFVSAVNRDPRTVFWKRMSAACVLAGMTRRQQGDAEGALSFDPGNSSQVKLAVKLAGVRPQRRVSEGQRAAAAARFAQYRRNLAFKALQEGVCRL